MNGILKAKLDKIIQLLENNKTLFYNDLIEEIAKNKDLLRYKVTIPNAIQYLNDNGITVVMPKNTDSNNEDEIEEDETDIINEEEDKSEYELDNEDEDEDENDNEDDYEDEDDEIEVVKEGEPTDEDLKEIEEKIELNKVDYFNEDIIKQYLIDISTLHDHLLTADEEKELARKYQAGDKEAKNLLAEYNLKLVVSVARHYTKTRSGLSFEDHIQNGNIGLMTAINRFDPDKGYKFSTYAVWWIRQSITRAIADEGNTIRLPVHTVEQLKYINKAIKELQSLEGREDVSQDYDRIAQICNEHGWVSSYNKPRTISPKKVKEYLTFIPMLDLASLSTPIGDDEESCLIDFVQDNGKSLINIAESNDMTDKFNYIFENYLTRREADILRKRFGFNGQQPMTLEQIGRQYGLSRERIRQIESKAIKKIKRKRDAVKLIK